MSKTHLIIPDPHAHYKHHNNRALWVSELIKDIKPDVVINLGDTADMPSLSGYDRGKKCFQGRTYKQDIEAHNDFQDKLWSRVKRQKKKLPRRITLIGNHEERINRAIELSPELDGAIGYGDLQLDRWYDNIVPYNGGTPGVIEVDGVHYAHYFVSGNMGRPVGGEHPAYSLITKHFASCTAGHQHVLDYAVRTRVDGSRLMSLCSGCYVDYESDWAGEVGHLWWSGVLIKRNVDSGTYDLQAVSIEALQKEYGHLT